MKSDKKNVEVFFEQLNHWQAELICLRTILLESALEETLKWGAPCYTFKKKNVAIIGGFKTNFVLSFFKGVLLKDTQKILHPPGENTRSARVIRFTNIQQIMTQKATILAYIEEAIELEKAGSKVVFQKTKKQEYPEEFLKILAETPTLSVAFERLTPGRKRGYLLFFSAPKQAKTQRARIMKCIPKILEGRGLNDWLK